MKKGADQCDPPLFSWASAVSLTGKAAEGVQDLARPGMHHDFICQLAIDEVIELVIGLLEAAGFLMETAGNTAEGLRGEFGILAGERPVSDGARSGFANVRGRFVHGFGGRRGVVNLGVGA